MVNMLYGIDKGQAEKNYIRVQQELYNTSS